jgi:hypothetical protein
VKRVEIDTKEAIRVFRWVDTDGMEEIELDLEGVLRNVEPLVEYDNPAAAASEVLLDMFHLARAEKTVPCAWVTATGNEAFLDDWIGHQKRGMPGDLRTLFGLPVYRLKSLPDEALILCATPYETGAIGEVSFAVKATMEVVNEPIRAVAYPGGINSGERTPATSKVAPSPGGLRKVQWQPPRLGKAVG